MAYIWAKTKSGNSFKMGVEDKHCYKNLNDGVIAVNRFNQPAASYVNNNPYCITTYNLVHYGISENFILTQGTDENQRVGNKVFLKFIHFTYSISMDGANYIANLSHGQAIDSYYRLRIMVVQFDEPINSNQDLVDWFKSTYTYLRTVAIANGGTVPIQSVHTAKLRESTAFTGSFRILYDKKTYLKKDKTVKMSTISIPIKQNVNFENTNNLPTDLKNIYFVAIGPCSNELDMDCVSSDQSISFAGNLNLFNVHGVIKYEYYDL